jgi:uncharacterized membrane protein YbaN (DUF454 family)
MPVQQDYSSEVHPHRSTAVRWICLAAGTLLVGLGILGLILPLLPGTPFLLLAAACYARASRRFYNWLLNNRFVGPSIAHWRRSRRIPRAARRRAVLVVVLVFALTILFVAKTPWLRALYAFMGLLIVAILLRLQVTADEELGVSSPVAPR